MTLIHENSGKARVVGVLGGGQLARMLALAGYPLGFEFVTVDPNRDAPAGALTRHATVDYAAPEARAALQHSDVVTYEFENVPEALVLDLARSVPVRPPPLALSVARDRLIEKNRFRDLGIPTVEFREVNSVADLDRALQALGTPSILKARTLGYDGRGQVRVTESSAAPQALQSLGGAPAILEAHAAFERELSIIAVRAPDGATRFYPLSENVHEHGILRISRAPAPQLKPATQRLAEDYAVRLMDALDYVGVLALELFECAGQLLANEFAPRVHNSGHWTIEGAVTSQFENHLRAIAGLPLGDTCARRPAAMVNLIGSLPNVERLLELPDVHVHLYGKAPRPGRKLGHVTVMADSAQALEARLSELLELCALQAATPAAHASASI